MKLYVGTSGFAYKEWIGPFYAPGTRDSQWLGSYARRLKVVEINTTFYRFPTAAGLSAWVAQVPSHFRFAIKAPRRITHVKRLRDVDGELSHLVDTVKVLGNRLGPLLFLLPPRMPLNIDALRDMLCQAPPGLQIAFAFRDPQWLRDSVFSLLSEHDCAVCFEDALMPAPVVTTDWGYVRLRRPQYSDASLAAAAAQVLAQPWRTAYVFIKHEAPDSPLLAQRFATLANLSVS
ncbi:MAG: DUF72 domain-containing protein [Gammaproteobacteria bacterium]|nr:DUF72 domain-containing protein [Gammaproteobacteria bacterium]